MVNLIQTKLQNLRTTILVFWEKNRQGNQVRLRTDTQRSTANKIIEIPI